MSKCSFIQTPPAPTYSIDYLMQNIEKADFSTISSVAKTAKVEQDNYNSLDYLKMRVLLSKKLVQMTTKGCKFF